jgi:predicted lysophospholipase L1 biosynthesis ABC-type transport system permease subunit
MRIVGTALFPQTGDSVGGIDSGAQIMFATLRRASPTAAINLVRFQIAGHADKAFEMNRVREGVAPLLLLPAVPPTTITSFGRAGDLPTIVALIVGVLAVLALANAMATSVFRRQHDFAILETLGYVRRQRAATIVASATTFALLVCVVGVPVGLVAGQRAWAAVANALGVASDPTTSALAIALIVPVLVLIANLVALAPLMLAGRRSPATPLRAG